MVLEARGGDTEQAAAALETLCRTYWYPLYAYLRRQGHQPADAEDLVQGLIARLLQRDFLKNLTPEKGRFRTFLLTCLRNHLADQKDYFAAQKRGGGQRVLPLEYLSAEERYLKEGSSQDNPERFFERQWALSVIEATLDRLKAEVVAAGKGALFKALSGAIVGEEGSPAYAEVARRLSLKEATVRSMIRRLRERYRELFREQIAQTVNEPGAVNEEIRHLLGVLRQ